MKKRILSLLGATLIALMAALGVATPAFAASDDVVDSMTINYKVNSDGSLDVKQNIVYRFGPSSGRHGIYVYFPTREPYTVQKDKDRVYTISNIGVNSPDPYVSTSYTTLTQDMKGGEKGRNISEVIKIGSASQTVQSATATYNLTYTISRAIMNNPQGDELYWDAITGDWDASIKQATVTVTTPTPVVKTNCWAGAQGQSTGSGNLNCDVSGSGTTQTMTATNLGNGRGLTFSTTFQGGAVNPNTPEIVDSPAVKQRQTLLGLAAATGASILAALGGAAWFLRTRGRDERYIGVPPGLMPANGQEGTIGRDNKPEIPVQFNPPPISVGEAGMLDDGSVDVRDTTATLVSLAVQGYLQLAMPEQGQTIAKLVRPDPPRLQHERDLIMSIFGAAPQVGTQVDLSQSYALADAHNVVAADLTAQLNQAGFYKHMPGALGGNPLRGLGGCFGWLAVIAVGSVGVGVLKNLVFLAPILPLGILAAWMAARARKGQRSALGRAMQDQIEGFRRYIATAEADQLKFEEGEDIFSKYLPWAIMFGLTERWTKVCQQLVAMGRIPDYSPGWYYGPWYGFNYFPIMDMDSSLNDSFSPAPPPQMADNSSGGSGFGSGFSGFGGGSIGGGGGGGGGGSW